MTLFLTGGSRGIGKTIKQPFEFQGITVIAPSREELNLADKTSISSYLEKNAALKPDIFIHCAGINELAGIDTITQEILERVFQVNVYAPIQLLNSFSKGMKERKYGKILFISSLYALVSKEKRIAYSSSKNALTGLCKTLTLELAPFNILTNLLAPGYVMTDMTRKNLSSDEIRKIEENIPTGRFQTEQEIADTAFFLCSEKNKSITGQLLAVDGGYICR